MATHGLEVLVIHNGVNSGQQGTQGGKQIRDHGLVDQTEDTIR